jgi:hypothetical protein
MPRYRFPALINAPVIPAPQSIRASARRAARTDRFVSPLERDFPHILEKIQALWGYPEMNLYFSQLAIDDRGDREGFPAEVWDDLHMLMQLHQVILTDW